MAASLDREIDLPDPIRVIGREEVHLDADALRGFSVDRRSVEVVCATGSRYTSSWEGIGVTDLLDVASAPAETTHLLVASRDGYRIAIPLLDGFDGLLAIWKDGEPIGSSLPYHTRFVAPDIEGARDVKGVRTIRFLALDPEDDPESHEQIEPDDDRFEVE
ncbi:MAG: molybdopterin-dependent oxidoreductase [Halanaeroarchaeum sp.]